MLWQDDAERDAALGKVARKGAQLEKVPGQYRADPDVALAAVAEDAEAWSMVGPSLRSSRDWVIEAVWRNWEVLQHVPRRFRSDHAVVLAAALQDEEALRYADPGLVEDPAFQVALEADEAPPSYQGECLRLVGDFNHWRTTDVALRLRRLPCEAAAAAEEAPSGEVAGASEPVATTWKHRIDVYLMEGWLAFQVLSCLWGFEFRLFPHSGAASAREPYRMRSGDPSAVQAALGGVADGRDACFFLQERQNSVVSIFVEISSPGGGPGTSRSSSCEAKVWYEAGKRPSECSGMIGVRMAKLQVASRRWAPRFMPTVARRPRAPRRKPRERSPEVSADALGGAPAGTVLLARAERDPALRPLLEQAYAMSARAFEPQDVVIGIPAGHHLALLADALQETTLAYCLYLRRPKDSSLHVHQLAVLEGHRGAGLGRWLLRWVTEVAALAELDFVRLASTPDARPFYEACGFRDDPVRGRTTPQAHPMELQVATAFDRAAAAGAASGTPEGGRRP